MTKQVLVALVVLSIAGVAVGAEPRRLPAEKTERDGRTVLKAHADPVIDLVFSTDGRRLASLSRKGEMAIWDAGAWTRQVFAAPGKKEYVVGDRPRQIGEPARSPPRQFLAYLPDGDGLLSGSLSQIFVWDAKGEQPKASF